MSQIDSTGTISMLEKMKSKVAETEALSDAYAEIAESNKSLDEEIDEVLSSDKKTSTDDALAKLKAKMKKDSSGDASD